MTLKSCPKFCEPVAIFCLFVEETLFLAAVSMTTLSSSNFVKNKTTELPDLSTRIDSNYHKTLLHYIITNVTRLCYISIAVYLHKL